MTKQGTHTPIDDEEAAEIASRFLSNAEDVGIMSEPDEWEGFVRNYISPGAEEKVSEAQVAMLQKGAERFTEELGELGVRLEYPITERPWQANFRDVMTGQYVSFADVISAFGSLSLF